MTETQDRFRVDVDGGSVSAVAYRATADDETGASPRRATLVLAHGAGAGQSHHFMVSFARAFAERGIDTVTFNFPYTERGRRLPDRAPVLEACYGAVVDRVHAQRTAERLVIGGKSMGGRVATQLAAHDPARAAHLAGIVCLGYPLHPPGKPERLRTEHLGDVPCPILFVQGGRDAFGTPEQLEPFVAALPQATLQPVEAGDHSFKVPKRLGRPQDEVYAEVQDAVVKWIVAL
jgi:predicted alpha/beta-hydrolase family hydrolase